MSTSTQLQAAGSLEEARRHVREMWATVTTGWERHADFVESRGAEVTRLLLDATMPRPGERVLELACGAGDVGLAAAPIVAPGDVVVSDVVAEMAAIAERRAAARALSNVTARTFGVEAIEAEDASFDIVLCREGLMFAADPARAVSELARVLRPGGRGAVAVWGPRERNPWLGLVFDAVSAQFGRQVPPPGAPSPFALAGAHRLEKLLSTNGLEDVTVREVNVPLSAASFDEWWTRIAALAGPLTTMLAALPEEAGRELESRLRDNVRAFQNESGGLRFPGVALIGSGRRHG